LTRQASRRPPTHGLLYGDAFESVNPRHRLFRVPSCYFSLLLGHLGIGPVRSRTHMTSPLGRPIRRREDAALLTGRGRFVDDLNVPGALFLAFARSPYAKARIVSIDTTAARRSAGVTLVVTAADLAGVPDMPL